MKHWRMVYLLIPFTFAVFGLILWCNSIRAEEVEEGAAIYRSVSAETEAETVSLWAEYVEGEGEPPEWWNPDEPMSAKWFAPAEPEPGEFGFMAGGGESYRQVEEANNEAGSGDSSEFSGEPDQVAEEPQMVITDEPHPPEGIDQGGIDYNICSTLYGADGLMMEQWEMGLFARILYREFCGTSRECCEAGADSIINLWASGYYGNSLFETLSAVTETGGYAFSTYPGVWGYDYDPDGLEEMQRICEDRFYNGTEYEAAFFRTDHYHGDWAIPCFCFPEDNVYFSTGKGW